MQNTLKFRALWLKEVDSTNRYVSSLPETDRLEGLLVAANFQHEGKGQRGNTWESNPDENLTFSVLLKPTFLKVQQQFLLSKAVAIAICQVLEVAVGNVRIKWPNDIYVGNRKIAGILIENSIQAHYIEQAIVGIGVNVNQRVFSEDVPNPTSIAIETNIFSDIETILDKICESIAVSYKLLGEGKYEVISDSYFNLLYRREDFYQYRSKEGELFHAKIVGIKDSGELILETDRGVRKEFGFKEVAFF